MNSGPKIWTCFQMASCTCVEVVNFSLTFCRHSNRLKCISHDIFSYQRKRVYLRNSLISTIELLVTQVIAGCNCKRLSQRAPSYTWQCSLRCFFCQNILFAFGKSNNILLFRKQQLQFFQVFGLTGIQKQKLT